MENVFAKDEARRQTAEGSAEAATVESACLFDVRFQLPSGYIDSTD
jgi:hypothetical protein